MIKTRLYANEICDKFEELLEKHNIDIPDEDRTGDEGEARLYGMTYAVLEEEVNDILVALVQKVLSEVSVELDADAY